MVYAVQAKYFQLLLRYIVKFSIFTRHDISKY